jgi:hypothetical protein
MQNISCIGPPSTGVVLPNSHKRSPLKTRRRHIRLLSALRKVQMIVQMRFSGGCFLISQILTQYAVCHVIFFYLIAFPLPKSLKYATNRL